MLWIRLMMSAERHSTLRVSFWLAPEPQDDSPTARDALG
jgi:hypothetical protein